LSKQSVSYPQCIDAIMVNTEVKKSYLFIIPWTLSALGGVNQVVENLYKQIEADGRYEPLLMVNSWPDKGIRKENINNIEHYFLRIRSPWDGSRKMLSFFYFFMDLLPSSLRLLKFFKVNNVSVVNIHYCSHYIMHLIFLKILGLFAGKLILSFHGQDFWAAKKSRKFDKFLWKIVLRYSDNIVTCSEFLKNELWKSLGGDASKISVVYNGVSTLIPYVEGCSRSFKYLFSGRYQSQTLRSGCRTRFITPGNKYCPFGSRKK
jgi:glycosyltransferase involved in cell wall biosynthesis